MTKLIQSSSLLAVLGLAFAAGCKSGGSAAEPAPTPPSSPTTAPVPTQAPSSGNAATPIAPPAAVPVIPDKDMTHTLSADAPFFKTSPAGREASPDMTLKAGTKVLVMLPGAKYSKVTIGTGTSGYTLTDSLSPIGK